MPGFIVHMGVTVQCSHGGQASPTSPNPRVLVSGQPVTTVPTQYVVAGCPNPPPSASNGPCLQAQVTSGATRVLAGGIPVLVMSSQATCTPTGVPATVMTTQTRVNAQ